MNSVMSQIIAMIDAAAGKPDFLDALFAENKGDALSGKPVVIFGAGGLGREMNSTLKYAGVNAVAFCDNDAAKAGSSIDGLPVISFHQLAHEHLGSLVIIAVSKHRATLARQLMDAGVAATNLSCVNDESDFVYMYSMIGSQVLFSSYEAHCQPKSYLDYLIDNQDRVARAHDLLHDAKSKSLILAKLALMASNRSFELFRNFIRDFSEPYHDFGFAGYDGTPEDHYYFNNDVIDLDDGEIYVDIGAYDGDTTITFTEACRHRGIEYERIFAFEPDTACYKKLLAMSSAYPNLSCHQQGLWSESTTLRFESSENSIHDQAAVISELGNIEIEVVSLDDFLKGEKVTLIKADPGGNVIPQVLRGAARTIRKYHPKLALGAYHGADSIFEIPTLLHDICPDYRISLRHNTFHLCDTDLIATCPPFRPSQD